MPFPLIAVAGTALTATLGYFLFKPDAAPAQSGGSPGALGENTGPGKKPTPAPLPPAKRPADLPKPVPTPAPTPISPPQPAPAPMPIPINPIPFPPNVLPPVPVPTPIQPTSQTGVVVAPSGLNLRSSPSTTGTVLYGMVAGTRVKIIGLNSTPTTGAPNGWYQVSAPNGMTGYASAQYILPDNGTNPVPVPLPIPVPNVLPNVIPPNILPQPTAVAMGIISTPSGVNLRSSPSTSGAIIKGLVNGTIVTVLSTALSPPTEGAPQGWVNVRDASGSTGWVSRQYCTPLSGPAFGAESYSDPRRDYRKRSRIKG